MGILQLYLILYNLVSCVGWGFVFSLVVVHLMGSSGQGPDPPAEFYGFSLSLCLFVFLSFVFCLLSFLLSPFCFLFGCGSFGGVQRTKDLLSFMVFVIFLPLPFLFSFVCFFLTFMNWFCVFFSFLFLFGSFDLE